MMWPFIERRRSKRRIVEWNGVFRCHFSGGEENTEVKVSEISLEGARLYLERLQIGPYHLLTGDATDEFTLSLSLEGAMVTLPITFKWFNQDEESHCFVAGVEFLELSGEDRETLSRSLRDA